MSPRSTDVPPGSADVPPLIGISSYREPADWGSWRRVPADLMPAAYADAVIAGGGVPVLLPPVLDVRAARAVLRRIDGLILGGGADLNPRMYDAPAHDRTAGWREDRDASELALLDAADGELPILGICRGMQMMAVHVGGTLLQHVPDAIGHDGHSPGPGLYGRTHVRIEPGSRTGDILGAGLTVPCHHHQAVAEHPGYIAVARAADGLVEAMESTDHRFRLAVQWHPETDTDMRLFAALVRAAGGGADRFGPPERHK